MLHLNIGKRIALGFAVILAIVIAVDGFTYLQLTRVQREQDQSMQLDVPMLIETKSIGLEARETIAALRGLMTPGLTDAQHSKLAAEHDAARKRLNEHMAKLQELVAKAGVETVSAKLTAINENLARWIEVQEQTERLLESEDNYLAVHLLSREAAPKHGRINTALSALVEGESRASASAGGKRYAALNGYHDSLSASMQALGKYLLTGRADVRSEFQASWQAGAAAYGRLAATFGEFPADAAAHLEVLRTEHKALESLLPKIQQMRATTQWNRAMELWNANNELTEKTLGLLDSFARETFTAVNDDFAVLARQTAFTTNLILISGIASVVIGLATATFITRSIVRPLRQVVSRLAEISEGDGDLTRRVEYAHRDEIGELATAFNRFATRVHDIMCIVAGSSSNVAAAATQIAASAEEMTVGVKRQSDQIVQLSAAATEMSASVTEVARNADTAREHADHSSHDATAGGEVVRSTVQDITEIGQVITASSSTLSELGQLGTQIGQMVSDINEIAEQTNLLALNAAIEAARAGEHGRGFAIVADEVRKLADRTTSATGQIVSSISQIQEKTAHAAREMEVGRSRSTQACSRADKAGESLQHIVGMTGELAVTISSIAAATKEQSAAADGIRGSIDEIAAMAQQTAEGATCSSQAAAELATRAEQLDKIVARFKLDRRQRDVGPAAPQQERRWDHLSKTALAKASAGKQPRHNAAASASH